MERVDSAVDGLQLDQDIDKVLDRHKPAPTFLSLPTELRVQCLAYILDSMPPGGFKTPLQPSLVDEDYSVGTRLETLLICHQVYEDIQLAAWNRTNFVCTNLFTSISGRLSGLSPRQIAAVRYITFIADARHFRKLLDWGEHPFGISVLRLNTLSIALHRSSYWHYLNDFTSDITKLLRHLKGVQRLVFVRNDARVKGSFKTWCNRLIGMILKLDHQNRYEKIPSSLETVWWAWTFDDLGQTLCLEAVPARPVMDEGIYMEQVKPLVFELMQSVESEEYNLDPRARIGF